MFKPLNCQSSISGRGGWESEVCAYMIHHGEGESVAHPVLPRDGWAAPGLPRGAPSKGAPEKLLFNTYPENDDAELQGTL